MNIFVMPKEGLKIRRPDTKRFLSSDGENVPNNSFWKRRLSDGDVLEIKLQAGAKPVEQKGGEQ